MGVVSAGMRHARHRRGERQAGALGHWQRVDICAQRDAGRMVGPEIAHQTRPPGQSLRVQPGLGQPVGDKLGGDELLATQLRVAVDLAAPGDQVVIVRGQPRLCGVGQRHRASIAGAG